MGRIYKRGKYWYIDVRDKGRRTRKRVGSSKQLAELALKDAEVKIARKEFGFAKNDLAIDELITRFHAYNGTNHRPTTVKRYRVILDHFQDFLGHEDQPPGLITELTPELFERYKQFRKNSIVTPNGKRPKNQRGTKYQQTGASDRTINIELEGLKTMLNLAIKWGYLQESPTRHVKPLKVNQRKNVYFLSRADVKTFLKFSPPALRSIFLVFLNSGMRKAELINLQWKDVDFKRRVIKINAKIGWHPKTGEREIPMNDLLFSTLKQHRKDSTRKDLEDYVFEAVYRGRSHNWLRTELIKIARCANLPKLTKLHTLRHTFASHLVMGGVDLPSVSMLLGHADIKTTMVYSHLAPEHLARVVNKIELS